MSGEVNDRGLHTQRSSIQMTELKTRLTHLTHTSPVAMSENRALVKELLALGTEALPLMPLVINKLNAGALTMLPDEEGIDLFLRSQCRDVLDWCLEKDAKGFLSIRGKIRLMTECECSQYEKVLLDILYYSWDKLDGWRTAIVEALGRAGGKDSLDMLQAYILPRIAEKTNEGTARLERMESPNPVTAAFALEVMAHQAMLEAVRTAISNLMRRQGEFEAAPGEQQLTGLEPEACLTAKEPLVSPRPITLEQTNPLIPVCGRRVELRGRTESPIVLGKEKEKLTDAQYDVVKALLDAGADGLTKDELVEKSRHEDARGVLRRLKQKDDDWDQVIHFAEKTGGGYRIG
jgi:hypothetical protein